MRLHFKPYDSAADVVKADGEVIVMVDDVFEKAAEMPSFAETMGAVALVGNLLCKEQQLVSKLDAMADDDETRPDVEAELDALRADMATKTLADLSA
jgi:hypothetical protein